MKALVKIGRATPDCVCWVCGKEFDQKISWKRHTADHLVATRTDTPLALACASCNSRRVNKRVGSLAINRLLTSPNVILSRPQKEVKEYLLENADGRLDKVDMLLSQTPLEPFRGEFE